MKVVARRDIAEAAKHELGKPDPLRYDTSQGDLDWCLLKGAMKEWKDYSWPFNARLFRGHESEASLRRVAAATFGATGESGLLERDGITGETDDALITSGVLDYKSTGWRRPTPEWNIEAMANYMDHSLQGRRPCPTTPRTTATPAH